MLLSHSEVDLNKYCKGESSQLVELQAVQFSFNSYDEKYILTGVYAHAGVQKRVIYLWFTKLKGTRLEDPISRGNREE